MKKGTREEIPGLPVGSWQARRPVTRSVFISHKFDMICAEYDNGYQLHEIAECLLLRVPRYPNMQRYPLPLRKRFTVLKFWQDKDINRLIEIRTDITCINSNNICYPDFVQ